MVVKSSSVSCGSVVPRKLLVDIGVVVGLKTCEKGDGGQRANRPLLLRSRLCMKNQRVMCLMIHAMLVVLQEWRETVVPRTRVNRATKEDEETT